MFLVAEGIACGCVLKTYGSSDIACVAAVNILSVVSVHLQNSAHTLSVALNRVIYCRSGIYNARIYAEEAELADKRVGSNLKRESREGLCVGRGSFCLLACVGVCTLNSGDICRSRHIIDNSVEHHLNALVAVRRTAGYGNHCVFDCSLSDNLFDFGNRNLLAAEVLFHKLLIELRNGFDELFVVLLGNILHILGDFLLRVICAVLVVINLGLHCNKVNDTGKITLSADRQLNGHSVTLEPVLHHLNNVEEIRSHDVHFVNVNHSGYAVVVSLTPYGL